jgi:hypothetical protein
VLADAFVLYTRLNARGTLHLARTTVLARYGVGHFREGRRIGSQSNAHDVMSSRRLRQNGIVVRSLRERNERTGTWREIAVEDRHSTPSEIAGLRIDFCEWLKTLSNRDRRIAETLALGETTSNVAHMFGVTAARISQLRRQFFESWYKFFGELAEVGTPAVVTF